MAYADPLNAATPADTDIAGQGDDRMRETKRAIQQRLSSFFQSYDADPMVPRVNSIPVDTFVDNTFPGAKLQDASVDVAKLDATEAIPANMVRETSIQDAAVTTNKLADQAVTAAKITNHTITALQLANLAVETAAIDDAAVTTAKLADGSVTLAKLDPTASSGRIKEAHSLYVFPGSTIILGAGTDYLQIDIANADLLDMPYNGPALVAPELAGLNPAAGEWPDGLVFQGCVIGAAGVRSLRVRIKNTNTFDVDVSGKTFYWAVTQAL